MSRQQPRSPFARRTLQLIRQVGILIARLGPGGRQDDQLSVRIALYSKRAVLRTEPLQFLIRQWTGKAQSNRLIELWQREVHGHSVRRFLFFN